MQAPPSSTFFSAVTGQQLKTTRDYYSLICNPQASPVLAKLALFTNQNSSALSSNSASAQQHHQGAVGARSGDSSLQTAAKSSPAQQPTASAATAGLAGSAASSTQSLLQQQQQQQQQVLTPSAQRAGAESPAGAAEPAAAAGGAGKSFDSQGSTQTADAMQMQWPALTDTLLDYSVWNTGSSTTPNNGSKHGRLLSSEPYAEPCWLDDLAILRQQAQLYL